MGDGNYLTTRRQGAEHYVGNVIEAYIKINKPYIFRNSEFQTVSEQITNDFGLEERIKGNQVQQFLKGKGYDGVVLSEDGKAVMVNAFDSEQIKSATDNIGTFDRIKKDIRYSVKRDIDGNKFVDVDPDLFDARDGESYAKTIARIIKDRFDNLISVNDQQIQINKTTNREWLRSESATYLA